MKMVKKLSISLILVFCVCCFAKCKKGWLEEKNNLNSIRPETLADVRGMLRNTLLAPTHNDYIGLAQLASDDSYVSGETLLSRSDMERDIYTWAREIRFGNMSNVHWNTAYEQVLYANGALETLGRIERTSYSQSEYDDLLGGALYFRAKAFFNLAQIFAPPYKKSAALNDLGIPLRLTTDPNVLSSRPTVSETYLQITKDLKSAAGLLTVNPLHKFDASQQAAYALLARCYLSMREYNLAGTYADSALFIQSELLDYNDLINLENERYPFKMYNEEVISHSIIASNYSTFLFNYCFVDSNLYALYREDDLRKKLYYGMNLLGGLSFKGTYSEANNCFSGTTTAEMYLIRAESRVRQNNILGALSDLNHLASHRYLNNSQPYIANNREGLLADILDERRRELAFRGMRWIDLRRLNQEPEWAQELRRDVNGETFYLPPNSSRYIYPLPDEVLDLTGMPQNKRFFNE